MRDYKYEDVRKNTISIFYRSIKYGLFPSLLNVTSHRSLREFIFFK